MAHDLPSGRLLADLHGFYTSARFASDGTVTLSFKVPPEYKQAVTDISINDGMALNISVWETQLEEMEGDDWLAAAIGLDPDPDTSDKPRVLEKRRAR